MTVTLFSFLGIGDYKTVVYEDSSRSAASPTEYFVKAAHELWAPERVRVLVTDEAQAKHGDRLRAQLPTVEFVRIPSGRTREELWELFRVLDTELRALAPDDGAVLDVTHGFRTQPLFAMGVVSHLRSTGWKNDLELVYGAFEAQTESRDGTIHSPIWDLTTLAEVVEWGLGLQIMLETGRTNVVSEAVERRGRSASRSWASNGRVGSAPQLTSLAKTMRTFGDDLETLRIGALVGSLVMGGKARDSSVASLRWALSKVRDEVETSLPAIVRTLDELAGELEALDGSHLDTLACTEGHRRLVELARLYLRLGRYPETLAVVREAMVLRHATPEAGAPGDRFDHDANDRAARALSALKVPINELRNDVEHGGFRKQPLPSSSIRERCSKLVDALENYPAEYSLEPTAPSPPVLANLSNHPMSDWPDAMRDHVKSRWEHVQVLDLAFPHVPSDLFDPEKLEELVSETIALVPADTTHAIVAGEPVVTTWIVRNLQHRGIECFAAASTRTTASLPDGRIARQFQFSGLRSYPPL